MEERIKYTSDTGYSGSLYYWHYDDWTEEWNYSMRIYNPSGREVLHAYNAAPKTLAELKHVVDSFKDKSGR